METCGIRKEQTMNKKILTTLFTVSVFAMIFFGIRLGMGITGLLEQLGASGGIIVGADAPTLIFWLTSLLPRTPVFWGALCSLAVFLTTGIAIIILNKRT